MGIISEVEKLLKLIEEILPLLDAIPLPPPLAAARAELEAIIVVLRKIGL